jgi:hypothetical protein
MLPGEWVQRAVEASFSEPERALALGLLEEIVGNETPRVKLAALALAGGSLAELRRMVAAARLDYRDVLYWAEYPEESGRMTREQAADRYRALGVPVPRSLAQVERLQDPCAVSQPRRN